MPYLSQIYIYPVKSLAGIRVEQWPVDKTGLRYDRKWMLIDEAGKFLSQRTLPKMALIKTAIDEDRLILSTPDFPELSVNLDDDEGEELSVDIWDDKCMAKSVGKDADRWFSQVLEVSCRLVYHPQDQVRKVDPDYAFDHDETAYSDGFPFLIVSEASLEALNKAMNREFSMVRFRPNLVIADCESYAEDFWRLISINNIDFRLPKPCSRCSIPNIDPETAISGREPLVTLAKLRQWKNKVYFGQNALHDSLGVLTVGSQLQIKQSGLAQPPLQAA